MGLEGLEGFSEVLLLKSHSTTLYLLHDPMKLSHSEYDVGLHVLHLYHCIEQAYHAALSS